MNMLIVFGIVSLFLLSYTVWLVIDQAPPREAPRSHEADEFESHDLPRAA